MTVLATSREILRISGEHAYRVPPLDFPSSDLALPDAILGHSGVELFVARIQAQDSTVAVDNDVLSAAAAICRQLDGVPLAIEFAAARAAVLGIAEVAARLEDRFQLLTSGRRTALPRHQTLRATLDWSYQLLPNSEQLLLRNVAVFPAGFTLDGAAAVVEDTGLDSAAVTEGVANLVAKSLITRVKAETVSRWHLLETIRAFCSAECFTSGCAALRRARVGSTPRSKALPA